jgi:hypothetical protein
MVVSYRRFGTVYRSHLHSLRCVKSQKGSDVNVIRKWRRGRQENETDDEKVNGRGIRRNKRKRKFIYLFIFI